MDIGQRLEPRLRILDDRPNLFVSETSCFLGGYDAFRVGLELQYSMLWSQNLSVCGFVCLLSASKPIDSGSLLVNQFGM